MDLRGLERLGEPGAEPLEVRLAKLTLALPGRGPLVEHLLREPAVVRGEGGDRPLEVLRDHRMELLDLRPARVRKAPRLVELLASELHEVLVDDVADVLEIADDGDEPDLLPREVGPHRLPPEAREEELDRK